MNDLNPAITGIEITQGIIQEVSYSYKEVIKNDDFSSNGITRQTDIKVVDGIIKFDERFAFSIFDVSEDEKNDLLALNGSNDVEFTLKGVKYLCTCTTFDYEADEQGQIIDSVDLTLKIKYRLATRFSMRIAHIPIPNQSLIQGQLTQRIEAI